MRIAPLVVNHRSVAASYHYRHDHLYHHHFMLCAIGLYLYCRKRNTNDCLHVHLGPCLLCVAKWSPISATAELL